MLLDEVPSRHRRRRVFRLVWDRRSDLLPKYNLDSDGEQEMRDLLLEGRGPFTAEEYCDETFRPKQGLQARRRFSDGSFQVFYSSLDPETADEEIRYWFPRYGPRKARTGFYSRLACSFSGLEKDLRAKVVEWPELTHESDYSFCNRLGAEAQQLDVDGLVVPSARCDGDNLPIFRREAISEARFVEIVVVRYDPDSGEVTLQ